MTKPTPERLRALIAWLRSLLPKRKVKAAPPKVKPAKVKPPPPVKPTPRSPTKQIVMYDSIEIGTVPPGPEAVAGYVGGAWPTYKELVKRFPKAHHLSIAIAASEDADCLDIENGDATSGEAAAWVKRQHARGIARPVVYASLSTMPAVLNALAKAGIPRKAVRVWTAHYTYKPHIELGSDATQYDDKALGRNLDISLCKPDFFS